MKTLPVVGKFASVVFASLVLVACSNTDTANEEAAAAEAASAAAAQEAAREAEARAAAEVAAEQQRLQDAAMAAGTVFYFAFDSSALTDEARVAVDAHIGALLTNDQSARLEGHTDERGTREYNLALAERRANAVRDYMVANGVPSYRIETISYGEESPVAFGSGEANWQQNRRVELK